MRDVAVIGVGMQKWGELWEKSAREIFVESALRALDDAGVDTLEAMYIGSMSPGLFATQEHIGSVMADYLGQRNIAAARVESACASGGVAFRTALMDVASGMHDVVLAGGVEKMTDISGSDATHALATAADMQWEGVSGVTFPGLYAMLAVAHMHKYGVVVRQTDSGPFVAVSLVSVIPALPSKQRQHISGIEKYIPDLVLLERNYEPRVEELRRSQLEAEGPYVTYFEYADAPGYALISVRDDGVRAQFFSGIERTPWRTVNLTELLEKAAASDVKVKRLGIPGEFVTHGKQDFLRSLYHLDALGIAKECVDFLAQIQAKVEGEFHTAMPK